MESAQKEKSLKEQQSVSKPIKKICFEMLKLRQAEQEAKQRYAELQTQLKNYFAKSGETNIWFSDNGKRYNITDVNPKKIVWDADKLKQQLELNGCSDVAKQVIESKFGIADWVGFSKFLKGHGIKASDVVPFLTIERKVNQKKLDELSELGEVTPEDVVGCFTVEQTNGYIKLSEKEEVDEQAE